MLDRKNKLVREVEVVVEAEVAHQGVVLDGDPALVLDMGRQVGLVERLLAAAVVEEVVAVGQTVDLAMGLVLGLGMVKPGVTGLMVEDMPRVGEVVVEAAVDKMVDQDQDLVLVLDQVRQEDTDLMGEDMLKREVKVVVEVVDKVVQGAADLVVAQEVDLEVQDIHRVYTLPE
uniref:Uncharacterized protein n=1 Tax=Oryza punctata TaxID=4537 RepID=A0A0E0M880_ORYPU